MIPRRVERGDDPQGGLGLWEGRILSRDRRGREIGGVCLQPVSKKKTHGDGNGKPADREYLWGLTKWVGYYSNDCCEWVETRRRTAENASPGTMMRSRPPVLSASVRPSVGPCWRMFQGVSGNACSSSQLATWYISMLSLSYRGIKHLQAMHARRNNMILRSCDVGRRNNRARGPGIFQSQEI